MSRKLALESEEWYVLCNWLRARENRTMYALRPRSERWERLRHLRRSIESQRDLADETTGAIEAVSLSDADVTLLLEFLRRRRRLLRLLPWRARERRDVLHLERHLRDQL